MEVVVVILCVPGFFFLFKAKRGMLSLEVGPKDILETGTCH